MHRLPLTRLTLLVFTSPNQAAANFPAPTLRVSLLTNTAFELRWFASTHAADQIEGTQRFQNWQWLTPPLAALPVCR